jgi:hypothetical protein
MIGVEKPHVARGGRYHFFWGGGRGNTVHYHDDGSKKLNACILLLSHMVYL